MIEGECLEAMKRLRGNSLDSVVTDPPYTVAGATLFLSRAAEALDGRGDVFLSFGSRRPDASFHLQRAIGGMGFAIVRLLRVVNGISPGLGDLMLRRILGPAVAPRRV